MIARSLLVVFGLAASVAAPACVGTTLTSPSEVAQAADLNTFSSQVLPGGSVSREFATTAAGIITVRLASTTPAGVMVGLGIGIPRTNGSCALNGSVEAVAGTAAPLSLVAESGQYCAKVFDLGTLSAPLPFTVSISRP